jgi:hypothetical protein
MTQQAAKRWRAFASILRAIGSLGYVGIFASSMFLIAYYSDKRTHAPQPEPGWTVPLSWTHPTSYGTAREEDRLQRLALWFIPSFGLIALGEAIKAYKLNDYSGYSGRLRL